MTQVVKFATGRTAKQGSDVHLQLHESGQRPQRGRLSDGLGSEQEMWVVLLHKHRAAFVLESWTTVTRIPITTGAAASWQR